MKTFEIDETKLSHKDLEYLDELLDRDFHRGYNGPFKHIAKKHCKRIIEIRVKLGLDVQENFMISDYECEFDEKINIKEQLNKNI